VCSSDLTGFFRAQELARLRALAGQLRAARRRKAVPEDANPAVFEPDR